MRTERRYNHASPDIILTTGYGSDGLPESVCWVWAWVERIIGKRQVDDERYQIRYKSQIQNYPL